MKFFIEYSITEYGSMFVDAETETEAEKLFRDKSNNFSLDNFEWSDIYIDSIKEHDVIEDEVDES